MNSIFERATRWIVSDDTGSSSKAIWAHMMCAPDSGGDRSRYPSDPDDLGRCLRLLELIPEWAPRITEMAQYSPGWFGLISSWDEIAAMMAEEVGVNWHKGTSAPRTYRAMKLAIADGYRQSGEYDCTFREDGTLSSYSKRKGGPSMVAIGGGEIHFGGSE